MKNISQKIFKIDIFYVKYFYKYFKNYFVKQYFMNKLKNLN